ncbi:MAG: hypothetical protein E5X94_02225 [Mesorhizobium sp.]|nr:MAG: hypothetical protein E5X94_02225 [Mesorhizobium sp.]TIR55471.1 MAG: hypothetical protein E5X28_08235 [Mesorhizobium sp.]TIS93859.1 MAG: hypothetical protein E5W99_07360 [Mesorhizobium sp.]
MVYDVFFDLPAELSGRLLLGLTQKGAEHLTEQANIKTVSTCLTMETGPGGKAVSRKALYQKCFAAG